MAAVLSNNMNDIKQVNFSWKDERMGIEVLGPDVNESFYNLQSMIEVQFVLVWEQLKGLDVLQYKQL